MDLPMMTKSNVKRQKKLRSGRRGKLVKFGWPDERLAAFLQDALREE